MLQSLGVISILFNIQSSLGQLLLIKSHVSPLTYTALAIVTRFVFVVPIPEQGISNPSVYVEVLTSDVTE
jgi:hypothetical protein